jgi:hypothetical protein
MALQTAAGHPTPADQSALRSAMLSVYYRSLGRQLELRGAPAALLPADVRPLGLAEALEVLRPSPVRFRDAVWRLVRAVPAGSRGDSRVERRYPVELMDVVGRGELEFLDERRGAYRRGGHLFGAALVACADGQWADFRALTRLLDKQTGADSDALHFDRATHRTLGQTAVELLGTLAKPANRERSSRQVAMIEDEVGLNIYDFVADFADAAAFVDFTENARLPVHSGGATVYPVSTVISQDSATLTTTATVTTVIRADFATIARAIDPLCWPLCSDVIKSAGYVEDSFGLAPLAAADTPPIGQGCPGCRPIGSTCAGGGLLLEERAGISWGADLNQQGSFHNVLRIHPYSVRADLGTVDLHFSLGRSVRSRVLWDERAGGLLLDHGYVKVRPLADNHWRVTSRKILKFSDRTPYANGPGWLDVGQMLNYLAPAALSWWLESEMYSAACPLYADHAQVVRRLGRDIEGNG